MVGNTPGLDASAHGVEPDQQGFEDRDGDDADDDDQGNADDHRDDGAQPGSTCRLHHGRQDGDDHEQDDHGEQQAADATFDQLDEGAERPGQRGVDGNACLHGQDEWIEHGLILPRLGEVAG